MVQIFQRESIFCSKICSGGSLFITKLVPGGTNFGGSIFIMTSPHPYDFLLESQVSRAILGTLAPEDTGATDGVDIVDQTIPVDGTITCACSSDTTPALSCEAVMLP